MTSIPGSRPLALRIPAHYQFRHFIFIAIVVLIEAVFAGSFIGLFVTAGPRVAYLSPAAGAAPNIWLTPVDQPTETRQITFSDVGIRDFDVHSGGRRIAFSERDAASGRLEISLLDIDSGTIQPLTDCGAQNMDCRAPVWRPGGEVIAYEQVSHDTSVSGADENPVRVAILDLSENPPQSRLLIDDPLVLGEHIQWSLDGSRLSFYDPASAQIVVYHWADSTASLIPSTPGTSGALSPNGTQLILPELTRSGSQATTTLTLENLANGDVRSLSSSDDPVDDTAPTWHPSGSWLAVARQYLDDRWTTGHQVYMMDAADGTVQPLVVDGRYHSAFFQWDVAGDNLLIQRSKILDNSGQLATTAQPEIWLYNTNEGTLRLLAENAFSARWVP